MMMPEVSCPYCRAQIASGEQTNHCPACNAVHHTDCWTENGGCAVVGCSAGPQAAQPAPNQLPPLPPSKQPVPVEVESSPPMSGSGNRWRTGGVIGLVAVALAGVGVGAALVVRDANKGDVSGSSEPAAATVDNDATTTVEETSRVRRSGPKPPARFTERDIEKGAKAMLNEHHELLRKAAGDPYSEAATKAYKLLSKDKRAAEEAASTSSSGRDYWATKRDAENMRIGQAICLPGTVDLRSMADWDPKTGVALVDLDFGSYAGLTWVKYEDEQWTYDAGYGHVPERTERWEGAPDETSLFSSTGLGC